MHVPCFDNTSGRSVTFHVERAVPSSTPERTDQNSNDGDETDTSTETSTVMPIPPPLPSATTLLNHPDQSSLLIDNSRNFYLPVRLKCGVHALCRPDVILHCPNVLQDLNTDLSECLRILPSSVHALVKRTRIWVNRTYAIGPRDQPKIMLHTTTHHHQGWLLW